MKTLLTFSTNPVLGYILVSRNVEWMTKNDLVKKPISEKIGKDVYQIV
ncbi:MAG: hypothetical protein HGA27_00140 [Peptococcaceae bacterium]|nr:hypothetical protein [Peptococcaceae bacterium]